MTNYIKWTDDLSVGVEALDDDHKTLISILNSYIEAVEDDEGVLVYDSIFTSFMDVAKAHFQREEELMEASGFEDYELHKEGHVSLATQLQEMRSKLMTSTEDSMQEDVRDFLVNWLEIHIMVKDQAYRETVTAYLDSK
ncbi:MAG: hemerythrin family protein [Magnetovibrio sp.]|nr:hemerythrin family protein [Magnetovibrio sp.]